MRGPESTLGALLAKLPTSARSTSCVRASPNTRRSPPQAATRSKSWSFFVQQPPALQRPIIESAAGAVIGRPPERVLELIA